MNHSADVSSLITQFDYLKNLTNQANLRYSGSVGVSIEEEMKIIETKLKKDRVLSVHPGKISHATKKKNGKDYDYFSTRVQGKILTSHTEDGLYDKLYEVYFGSLSGPQWTLRRAYREWSKEFESLAEMGHRSYDTLRRYQIDWDKYLEDSFVADADAESLTPKKLYEFYMFISANASMTRKNLGNVKSLLNHLFRYMENNGVNVPNYNISTRDLICKDVENGEDVYTDKEREAVIKTVREDSNRVYARAVELQFHLCARVGEIKALSWEDVDFEEATLFIHREMVAGKDEEIRVNRTKAKDARGNRRQNLTNRALELLKEQLLETKGKEFVFLYNGKPLTTHVYNEVLKRSCERANVRYLSSHKIRFWSVTAMSEAGVPAMTLQKTAGHLSPSTTDHYKRPSRLPGVDKETWDRVFS